MNKIIELNMKVVFNLLKTVLFFIIFFILIIVGSRIFSSKKIIDQGTSARGFYGEPYNSIDILMIGNSNAYCGFSPMVIWKEHGFASYVSGEGNQDISQAYHLLQEALSCQNPKLVLLETDEIFQKNHNVIESSLMYNFQRIFPILGYHNRWKALTADDFIKPPVLNPYQSNSKGFSISVVKGGYNGKEYMVPNKTRIPIDSITLYYLNKFVDLCEERHIKLVFVDIPCAGSWNYSKHNTISDYAEEHKIPFLDLNINRDRFGFDWKTDTRDSGGHLNCSGAQKVSLFIGDYIKRNYTIPDYRKDAKYQTWNNALPDYEKKATAPK